MYSGQATQEGYLRENYRFFHLRDTAGQERDYHFHAFDKLVILLSGRVEYEVETSVYPLRPWDVLLVRHHAIHKANIDRSEPYERVILYIDGRAVDRLAPEARLMDCFTRADRPGGHLLVPDAAARGAISRSLEELETALADSDFGAETLRNAAVMRLLVCLNRALPDETPAGTPLPRLRDERIGRALSYIHAHLDEPLTVERLAALSYMSRYHFMRLFKEQTGAPVHAYIRQRRLLRAAERIRSGVPAGQAAAESGYGDYSAFYRAFRDCFGASPSDIQ